MTYDVTLSVKGRLDWDWDPCSPSDWLCEHSLRLSYIYYLTGLNKEVRTVEVISAAFLE